MTQPTSVPLPFSVYQPEYQGKLLENRILDSIARRKRRRLVSLSDGPATLLITAVLFGVPASDGLGAAANSLGSFLSHPSAATWTAFEDDVEAGKYGPPDALYPELLEYHSAREHRDLPNSMALIGITPDDYVKAQAARADAALEVIRQHQGQGLWRFLSRLATQTFDDGLVWTGTEIAARLSPERFDQIAAEAVKKVPANGWIVERVRERWLRSRSEAR
jgi:hypothetical protein